MNHKTSENQIFLLTAILQIYYFVYNYTDIVLILTWKGSIF